MMSPPGVIESTFEQNKTGMAQRFQAWMKLPVALHKSKIEIESQLNIEFEIDFISISPREKW